MNDASRPGRVLPRLLLCLLLAAGLCAQERVVAVADVHGDYDALVSILQQAKLIDATGKWTGGKAVLVQTGDLLDRGPKVREVLDLMMALEKQAPAAGGRVVQLLGNHEVMNLMGDLRYVPPEEFATFACKDSEKRRQRAYKEYVRWHRRAKLDAPPQTEEAWRQAHPPGFLEQREAFSPSGKYGRWLRSKDAVFEFDGSIFLHGGINPELQAGPQEINRQIREDLRAFDLSSEELVREGVLLRNFTLDEMTQAAKAELARREAAAPPAKDADRQAALLKDFLAYPSTFSFHPAGPLWFRGYDQWTEEEGAARMTPLLERLHAQRVVAGHTPQRDGRIRSRFGGRVYLIDTGMLASYYNGRASALEISRGEISAVYTDSRVVLARTGAAAPQSHRLGSRPETPGGGAAETAAATTPAALRRTWQGPDGPLPFQNDQEVLDFLATARVLSGKDVGEGVAGVRKLLLEKDGVRAYAAFRTIDQERTRDQATGEMMFRDAAIFEPAAYHLSLLLGTYNVPPAIERKAEGRSGTVQLWMEGVMTEGKRRKEKLHPPDVNRWNKQMQNMHIFDNLVLNMDRNLGNLIIQKNDWTVWLIDHTRAFRRRAELRYPERVNRCGRALYHGLQNLDEAELRRRLSPYLRKIEIDALLKRRDKILKQLGEHIARQGEAAVLFDFEPAPSQRGSQ